MNSLICFPVSCSYGVGQVSPVHFVPSQPQLRSEFCGQSVGWSVLSSITTRTRKSTLLCHVRTGTGDHPASCATGTPSSFLWGKGPGV